MVPLAELAAGRYSERFLRAIDHALAVRARRSAAQPPRCELELGVEERRRARASRGEIPTAPTPLERVDCGRGER